MRPRSLEIADESRNAMPAQTRAAGRNTPLRLTSCMRSSHLREEERMPAECIRDQGGLHSGLQPRLMRTEPDQLFTCGNYIRLRKLRERLIECPTCRHLSTCLEQSDRGLPDR